MTKKTKKSKKIFSPQEEKILKDAAHLNIPNPELVGDIVLSANCVVRRNIVGEKFIQEDDEGTINRLIDKVSPSLAKVCASTYRHKPFANEEGNDSINLMLTARSAYISSLLGTPVNRNYGAYLGEKRKNSMLNFSAIYEDNPSRYTLLGFDDHITHITTSNRVEVAFSTAFEDVERIGAISGVDYAVHERFGYLTTKPEYCGSGATIAVLLALPALAIRRGLEAVFKGVQRLEYDIAPAVKPLCDLDMDIAAAQRGNLFGGSAPGALYYVYASVPQENYVEFLRQFIETVYMVAAAEVEERLSLIESNRYISNLDENLEGIIDLYLKGPIDVAAADMSGAVMSFANQSVISHEYLFDALSCLCINRIYNMNNKISRSKKKRVQFSPYAQYQIHQYSSFWFAKLLSIDLIYRQTKNGEIFLEIAASNENKKITFGTEIPSELISLEDIINSTSGKQSKRVKKQRVYKNENKGM